MFLAYRFLTTLIFPFLVVVIFFRKLIKKEDAKRYKERFFLKEIDYDLKNQFGFMGQVLVKLKVLFQ